MWNNFWLYPSTGTNNMWGGDVRGYTGYKLAGTGGTEGAPYTPRVGAITIDKRNDALYVGLNWQSRLPASNNPDFEPALIAYDGTGRLRWWARLYKEYNDDSVNGPQNLNASVSSVNSTTEIQSAGLAGTAINISRKTGGSDGYVNGYRRLYWLAGSANENTFSEISDYDQNTGTITLLNAPTNTVLPNDPFLIDGTEMTKTHTSTPDQYIDSIAIDYSTALNASEQNGVLFVAARTHGNNVSNFWSGNAIKANPGGQGFKNGFTGTNGNAHYTWLGKYRDEGIRSTILAATYLGEYSEVGDFGDYAGFGSTYSDPLLDFWPDHNGGWPDMNTTTISPQMVVNNNGQLVIIARGRSVHTTSNAYQRNIRPKISGKVSAVSSAQVFTAGNVAGAQLFLDACRVRINGEIRTVTGFDNETGQLTLDTPLTTAPSVNDSLTLDEGTGSWGRFVRVYTSDLSSLVYSTLLDSAIAPVDGSGGGENTQFYGVWPISEGVLVAGYHKDADSNGTADGNALPTRNVPAWGASAPNGETSVLAKLYFTDSLTEQQQYFVDHGLDANVNPTIDSDIDGMSNEDEFTAGTNPNNINDVFELTPSAATGGMKLQTPTVSGKYYRISWRASLMSGDWAPVAGYGGTTVSSGLEIDLDVTLEGFYRVEVSATAFE
jgi:hypothetical protein